MVHADFALALAGMCAAAHPLEIPIINAKSSIVAEARNRCVELARDHGADVLLFEMAPNAGGRARDAGTPDSGIDNGQHICIGAYSETLRVLKSIGVSEDHAFLRTPLCLVDAAGAGLRLRAGSPRWAFARAVLARRGWGVGDRIALLARAGVWAGNGFACSDAATVADLCAGMPSRVVREFIEPLCVAALNTPAHDASGTVFLRVLRDALSAGTGASDLLLPKQGLSALFPEPALARLRDAGAAVRFAHRVERIDALGAQWDVDGETVDRVIVACSAAEASRLIASHDAAWSERTRDLGYEPIVTVYATSTGTRLREPMLLMHADAARPAQFVFDRGRLGGPEGLLAFVVSGAASWVERGLPVTEQAVLQQASEALMSQLHSPLVPLQTIAEKRATFRCTPGLRRPRTQITPGLMAAGDYVEGPYPATLEGAVRSGTAAARAAIA